MVEHQVHLTRVPGVGLYGMKIKKATLRKLKKKVPLFLILLGTAFIVTAVGIGVHVYQINHSPFDVIDTDLDALDSEDNFLPLVQLNETHVPEQTKGTLIPSQLAMDEIIDSQPEQTAVQESSIPDRIVISAISLDAPVVPIHKKIMHLNDQEYEQWLVPNQFAAGWHETSALLGDIGNTVLNGHHNVYGRVFKDLVRLQVGDEISVFSGSHEFIYIVEQKLLLPERFKPLEVRRENAKWIMPTTDERLTLVTCWPSESNTHRVIVVAFPK